MLVRQVFVGTLLVIGIGLLLYGTWHLTRLPAFTISAVTAEGGITIQPAVVVTRTEEALRGSYYRLIPKRFTYFYPETAIREQLAQIPRIKDIEIERVQRTQLRVTYDEYQPFALWCTTNGEDCVFIDTTGFGFAPAPVLRGGAFVRYHNRLTAPTVGQVGVAPNLLANTNLAARTMASELDLRVNTVVLDDRDIIYELGGGGEIRTAQSDDIELMLNNLETVLASDEFSHLEPGNFEYIDLRYGNKVFVQEELPEVATSTATTTINETDE